MAETETPCLNTDREIWHEREGGAYSDRIFVTENGAIGINCGGMVVVQSVRAWHALATSTAPARGLAAGMEMAAVIAKAECAECPNDGSDNWCAQIACANIASNIRAAAESLWKEGE
jgi:hypothetical protein